MWDICARHCTYKNWGLRTVFAGETKDSSHSASCLSLTADLANAQGRERQETAQVYRCATLFYKTSC